MTDQSEFSQEVQLQSPGSMLSASIYSHQLSSFEIDETSSIGMSSKKVNHNWRLGMPWFAGAPSRTVPSGLDGDEEVPQYYGGLMKSDEKSRPNPPDERRRSFGGLRRIPFRLPRGTNARSREDDDDDESISDFSKSEWTPPDSAYGAACPVCGWIPKHVRRMIEFSLICLMVLAFLYMVVTLSSHISNAHKDAESKSSSSQYSTSHSGGFTDDLTSDSNSTYSANDGSG
jgi:hypothetical protein